MRLSEGFAKDAEAWEEKAQIALFVFDYAASREPVNSHAKRFAATHHRP
jgi:hypothetical protein